MTRSAAWTGCALLLATASLAGCGISVTSHVGHPACAAGPGQPISAGRALSALRKNGLRVELDRSLCFPGDVADFHRAPDTFCNVEKIPPPRMRENPTTIFSGRNASGKGAEVIFQNLTCVLYQSGSDRDSAVAAVIRAMRQLGGRTVAAY